MDQFTIEPKSTGDLEGTLIEVNFEKILREKGAEMINKAKKKGSIRDVQRGFLGSREEIYEIEGEGVIIVEKVLSPERGFPCIVSLLGFNKGSECYRDLKAYLENPQEQQKPQSPEDSERKPGACLLDENADPSSFFEGTGFACPDSTTDSDGGIYCKKSGFKECPVFLHYDSQTKKPQTQPDDPNKKTITCKTYDFSFQVQKEAIGAYTYMNCPFGDLVDDCGLVVCLKTKKWCSELHPPELKSQTPADFVDAPISHPSDPGYYDDYEPGNLR